MNYCTSVTKESTNCWAHLDTHSGHIKQMTASKALTVPSIIFADTKT